MTRTRVSPAECHKNLRIHMATPRCPTCPTRRARLRFESSHSEMCPKEIRMLWVRVKPPYTCCMHPLKKAVEKIERYPVTRLQRKADLRIRLMCGLTFESLVSTAVHNRSHGPLVTRVSYNSALHALQSNLRQTLGLILSCKGGGHVPSLRKGGVLSLLRSYRPRYKSRM